MEPNASLPWSIYLEMRKEILATQQLRSRAIEFKVTLVGAAIGLFVANRAKLGEDRLIVLAAFAAIFFDFLIASYSVSIKRQHHYLRDSIEPQIRTAFAWPSGVLLWEEHVSQSSQRQILPVIVHLGLTVLATLPSVYVLTREPMVPINSGILAVILLLLVPVVRVYAQLGYFVNVTLPVRNAWRRIRGQKQRKN